MKALTLCADDFAQSTAISAAIIELIAGQRICATSVMSQSPLWPELASELNAVAGQVDIGLHFNLTHPFNDEPRPLYYWLLNSQLRRLSRAKLRDSWLDQIDRFSEYFLRLPDFIDGHQHVHAFPVIRDAMFDAITLRWPSDTRPYLRAPDRLGDAGNGRFKAKFLKLVSKGFSQQSKTFGCASSPWFAGVYVLSPHSNFSKLMRHWLKQSPDGSLLMCHPGLANDKSNNDPIGPLRAAEFRYLSSQQFIEDCQLNKVQIHRFSRLLPEPKHFFQHV